MAHRNLLRRLQHATPVWAWLLAILLLAGFTSPAQGKGGKRQRKPGAATKASTKPNFDLGGWLHEARLATHSTSVGQANRGRLQGREKMDLKGRSWRFLPAIRQRGTYYGTFALVRLLEDASEAVAAEFPGALLEIGNIGRADGGPVTQSKSHQTGRDVDIAFFALDRKGRSRPTGRMLRYDANLRAGPHSFDVARNWALVKALIQSERTVVQWLFVSSPIRTALLKHARQQQEPQKLIRLAGAVLHQPGDSAAHADHMHIRIFCSDWDRSCGCRDYGPERSSLARDNFLLHERLQRLNRRARKGLTSERLAALETLIQLPEVDLHALVEDLLCDRAPEVVARAVRLLPRVRLGREDETLARKLSCAGSLDALYVLFKPVATYQHKRVWGAARKLLTEQSCLEPKTSSAVDGRDLPELCALAAQALGYSRTLADGLLLVPLLEARNRTLRRRALRGLETLYVTRQPVVPPEGELDETVPRAQRWRTFVESQHKLKWARQAAAQMQRQGFAVVKRMIRKENAAELLRAVKADHPVSFTAQIALARINDMEWFRPLKAKAAHARFSALTPATQVEDAPPQTARAVKTAKTRRLPALPTLD